MSQWKSNANTSGAPKWGIRAFRSRAARGSGKTQLSGNNTSLVVNTTPDSFTLGEENGIFPVTPGSKANTSGESAKIKGEGWVLRTVGEGPILTFNAVGGAGFLNGDSFLVSNGSHGNTIGWVTANATGNLVSASYVAPGGGTLTGNQEAGSFSTFVNTSVVAVGFNRERHVANLNIANGVGVTMVGVGNANTILVSISNTGNTFAYGAGSNAIGSFTSGSGTITNTQTQAIVWGANGGQFSNNQTNTAVVVTFTNANGTVVTFSGGTPTISANLAPSTTGAVTAATLGGRAGRKTYEMLVIDRHINATATSSVANTAGILPE